MRDKAVAGSSIIAAYIRAAKNIMGTTRENVEVVAGTMFPSGTYDGYKVSIRIERYVDQAAKLAAAVAAAQANGVGAN